MAIQPRSTAQLGDVVAVEVLQVNQNYPYLELLDGATTPLVAGERIIGVLGSRQALRGFVGCVPDALAENDQLSVLNVGGVIGKFLDATTALGEATRVRYLGTLHDERGVVNLRRDALPVADRLLRRRPIILVVGTCMNVGKTVTASELIRVATANGFRVGAAKLSGVGAIRDLKKFESAGAADVKSFLDCGLPSTVDAEDLAPIVKTIANALDGDLLIFELGDGIFGHYRVDSVIADADILASVAAVVVCASDLMGAYGAHLYLNQLGVRINAFSGLATENISGSAYLEARLGIPAVNALKYPEKLFATLNLGGSILHMTPPVTHYGSDVAVA
ncbi:MAG: hypothetical protein CFK52_13370 [Chloracidobacterium sp. CP2_5A]|nr:MAG: hypothetical protein CFK52_13370 [Chloracidobacterium sp. CP2_5A]